MKNDPVLVGGFQRLRDLFRNRERLVYRQAGPASAFAAATADKKAGHYARWS